MHQKMKKVMVLRKKIPRKIKHNQKRQNQRNQKRQMKKLQQENPQNRLMIQLRRKMELRKSPQRRKQKQMKQMIQRILMMSQLSRMKRKRNLKCQRRLTKRRRKGLLKNYRIKMHARKKILRLHLMIVKTSTQMMRALLEKWIQTRQVMPLIS